jgi:aspartyl/glutamyl-tRNA(Asn/Gln) amidotransferase C subunit
MSTVLDPATVVKIAKLARISSNPTPEFIEKFGAELGAILGYVEELQQIDTSHIAPTDGIRTIAVEELRTDEPDSDAATYQRIRQNIINNFPNKQGDLLVLPGIFD